jgi:ribosomal protein L37AE/L43A
VTPSVELSIGKRALAWAKSVFAFGKRIATLEARVSALEAELGKHPPDVCDYCGERGMRKMHSFGVMHGGTNQLDVWTCEKCGKTENRIVKL